MKPICQYCKQEAQLVKGNKIYPKGKNANYLKKWFWHCAKCEAWVGCLGDTQNPMGIIANKELRKLKQEVHEEFDSLWNDGDLKRGEAYRWLSNQLGTKINSTHIGMFDEDTCKKVISLCKEKRKQEGMDEENFVYLADAIHLDLVDHRYVIGCYTSLTIAQIHADNWAENKFTIVQWKNSWNSAAEFLWKREMESFTEDATVELRITKMQLIGEE